MPPELALDLLEAAEDAHVEEEERDEGDDASRDVPDPVHVDDDVGAVQAEVGRNHGYHGVLGAVVIV